MNRYSLWKYAIMLVALFFGVLYTAPNFFGEAPAVQVLGAKTGVRVTAQTQQQVIQALQQAGIAYDNLSQEGNGLRVRFTSPDVQIKAKDVIQTTLVKNPDNPNYVVALGLVSRSPAWLEALYAKPMYLGLDLRGGVHFLMQVETKVVLEKQIAAALSSLREALRQDNVRYQGLVRDQFTLKLGFTTTAEADRASQIANNQLPGWLIQEQDDEAGVRWTLSLSEQEAEKLQTEAVKQNIQILHNRVNELGVAEPVIQQQGLDRIVVQLPGVQDTAKAKDIIGRTATLELRLVDESTGGLAAEAGRGSVPFGSEAFPDRNGNTVITKREVILTGENLTDAQPGFEAQSGSPVVNLTLDGKGSRIFGGVTRQNINKRMAIVLFEKGRGEVVTAPVIRSEIGGGRVQISGSMTSQETTDTALLLRAGSLAAPMEIIEERTVGPSLGAENIARGFDSVTWGFLAIIVFMCIYYMLFGAFSSIALGLNILLLVAVLSLLQATLTLPGMAAMALALGMAIDANVLINERVREELRRGSSPQAAISAGYDSAWGTILDSNITTLIAGLALLIYGSGPVRGFAVVHCIGILTSMFSAVFFSRGLVNFWYGQRKKLVTLSIGTIWRTSNASLPTSTAAFSPHSKHSKKTTGAPKTEGKKSLKERLAEQRQGKTQFGKKPPSST